MNGIKRRCIRCKELKPKTIGNFKRRESYLSFKPDYDIMCRVCRDIQSEKKRIKVPKRIIHKRTCAREGCDVFFQPNRLGTSYCSKRCRILIEQAKSKQEALDCATSRKTKSKIPKRFLVRGRIYGVDY